MLIYLSILSFILISLSLSTTPDGRVYYYQFHFADIQTKDQEDNWQVGNDFSPGLWPSKSWMRVGPHTLTWRESRPSRGRAQTSRRQRRWGEEWNAAAELKLLILMAEIAQLWFACCGNCGYICDKRKHHKINETNQYLVRNPLSRGRTACSLVAVVNLFPNLSFIANASLFLTFYSRTLTPGNSSQEQNSKERKIYMHENIVAALSITAKYWKDLVSLEKPTCRSGSNS